MNTLLKLDSIESRLINTLAEHQRGFPGAVSKACAILNAEVLPEHSALKGVISGLLRHSEDSVRMHASLALGRFKSQALDSVPALASVLSTDSSSLVIGAAASALGSIGGMASVQALVRALGNPHMTGASIHIFSAFKRIGADAEAAIPAIEKFIQSTHDRSIAVLAREAVQGIYSAIRTRNNTDLQNAYLPKIVPLFPMEGRAVPAAQHFAQYREELPAITGLAVDRRLNYSVHGSPQEIGLRIYKTPNNRSVVVFTADDSSTPGMQTVYEHLATAVRHMYGLDPSRTTWIEHWSKTFGGAPATSEVQLTLHKPSGRFEHPDWTPVSSLQDKLRSMGISVSEEL